MIAAVPLIVFLLAPFAASAPAAKAPAPTKRVLMLHQTLLGGPVRARFDAAFVDELRAVNALPLDVYEEAIEMQRFPGVDQSRNVTDYLRIKYADSPIDVVVTLGAAALAFARANRMLFGSPTIVALASPAGTVAGSHDDVTGLQGGFFVGGTVDLALALLPDTDTVIVIDGVRGNTGDLQVEVQRQLAPRHLRLEYLRDLPVADVMSRLSDAPPHSIALLVRQTLRTPTQDVDPFEALDRLVRASPVPVFSQLEEFMGRGILGGDIWRFETDARRVARMVVRLAGGARASDIPVERVTTERLIDWQQLTRWGIPPSRIPASAIVMFRQPTFFQTYRRYVVGGVVVFVLQLALIVVLLVEREWRRRAEADAESTRGNLAHMTRVSAMGELAASLTHELNQPLTSILCNSRAARNMLSGPQVSLPEVQTVLDAIVEDDKRATDVIARVRDLVRKHQTEHTRVDMNDVVGGVVKLLRSDSIRRNVEIRLDLTEGGATVEGDRVQLQQVMLNLLLNALEAADVSGAASREVLVATRNGGPDVTVEVSDHGPGLPPGPSSRLFEPFYTTKASGMGMGLSITRSIVEAHGGRVWATNGVDGGARFHVRLPAV